MKKICLPEIPKTWLIGLLMFGLVALRFMDIDSFTTAALMAIVGYLTGVKLEQIRKGGKDYGNRTTG